MSSLTIPAGITKNTTPRKGKKQGAGAPNTPTKQMKPPVTASTTPRLPPCENCVRSAIAGKGDFSRCVDCSGARTARCFACFKGNHKCVPCRDWIKPLALKFREVILAGNDSSMVNRCRTALRLQFELIDTVDPVLSGVPGCSLEQEEDDGSALSEVLTLLGDQIRKLGRK